MGLNVLLITTDQQRFDALGCNGGKFARTPVLDGLATTGINFSQARSQSTVCMPSRSTILTGQSIRCHGVTSNGIQLPPDQNNLAHLLQGAGYKTALIGKAHLDPHAGKIFFENTAATENTTGPYRGFDHMELCGHTGRAGRSLFHYPKWLLENHPEYGKGYHEYAVGGAPSNSGWTKTGAPQVADNPIPIELYHTHWTAARTIDWLGGLDNEDNWFCWMSFPDPHHPWDPPREAARRFNWRDLPLPEGYPGSPDKCLEILETKPHHWKQWFLGEARFAFEVPPEFVPAETTADRIREVNAMVHAENELIDEAIGQVIDYLKNRGWDDETEIIFTTDHGEFQGDFGMLFKGPYHIEALMHVPLIWHPAPSRDISPLAISNPVGHVDIAPTICSSIGLNIPNWMQGVSLPTTVDASRHERTITEWYDTWEGNTVKLQTLYRDGWVLTRYGKTNIYDGTEGELYNLADDPQQWVNLWSDLNYRSIKLDLLSDLVEHLPTGRRDILEKVAPV